MKTARDMENIVMRAVESGELIIRNDGTIWRKNGKRGERNPGNGYLQARFMEEGVRGYACSHRLVYRKFKGEIPPGLTINHMNGVKDDNRPENLELATYSEQIKHAREVLGKMPQDGENNNNAKLTACVVLEIRRRRNAGESLNSIAAAFGTTFQQVSRIARGSSWASI